MAVNYMSAKDAYPAMGGYSLGEIGSGNYDPTTPEAQAVGASGSHAAALSVGGQASPLLGLAVFGGMLVATMLVARNLAGAEGFGNIKASAYNVVVMSLAAATGIPALKFALTKFPVPGVSTWVLAA